MTCNSVAEYNFSVKKGSRTVKTFVAYSDSVYTTKEDLSSFDKAEIIVFDKRGGTILFTVTGTITQGTSTIEFIFAKADTENLTNNFGFYNLKLSNSGDSSLDRVDFEGTIGFLD